MSRHWTRRGKCRQDFTIKVNVESLINYLTDKILEQATNVEAYLDESYVDIDQLVIKGTYYTPYEWTHYDATREEPAENDVEREYMGPMEIPESIPEEIRGLIKVTEVEEDEDDADYETDD